MNNSPRVVTQQWFRESNPRPAYHESSLHRRATPPLNSSLHLTFSTVLPASPAARANWDIIYLRTETFFCIFSTRVSLLCTSIIILFMSWVNIGLELVKFITQLFSPFFYVCYFVCFSTMVWRTKTLILPTVTQPTIVLKWRCWRIRCCLKKWRELDSHCKTVAQNGVIW